jgi:hypothetical protein
MVEELVVVAVELVLEAAVVDLQLEEHLIILEQMELPQLAVLELLAQALVVILISLYLQDLDLVVEVDPMVKVQDLLQLEKGLEVEAVLEAHLELVALVLQELFTF